jgi:alpha-L-fucosidase 2
MLLQNHEGDIHLLPALPSAWPSGRVTGLRARDGFIVDLAWSGGGLSEATVRARRDGTARLRYRGTVHVYEMNAGESVTFRPGSP